jgi:hypothetical protein
MLYLVHGQKHWLRLETNEVGSALILNQPEVKYPNNQIQTIKGLSRFPVVRYTEVELLRRVTYSNATSFLILVLFGL